MSYSEMRLLVIAPHSRIYIGDQLKYIKRCVQNLKVVVPQPYFSKAMLSLPYMKNQFGYLKNSVLSEKNEFVKTDIIRFLTIPVAPIRKRHFHIIAKSVLPAAREFSPSIIHAHFLEYGYAGLRIKNETGAGLVLTIHGGDAYEFPFRSKWHESLSKLILKQADCIITVSRKNQSFIESLGIKKRKIKVINNGFDPDLFKPLKMNVARQILGLPLSRTILLAIGNLVNVKGHQYLIDAMVKIAKKRNDIHLIIIGDGPLKSQLVRRAQTLNISHLITFLGHITHDEIPKWLNASDLFVVPSINEGFPTVIPEALACGKPIIATNVGGNPEIITNDTIGYLVEPTAVSELAERILSALDTKWDTLMIRSYAQQYSWKQLTDQILSVYRKINETHPISN